MSDSSKAVFLSYASQDADAARHIAESLRGSGVEVWFDQSELVGGDAWDHKIRTQIKECALLIPIISQNTQSRTEGYFRLEWRLADQRTHLMAKGRPFLLPVVIDDTTDAEAQVPDSFTEVQWTRLPRGDAAEKFAARVKTLLSGGSNAHGSTSHAPFVAASSEPAPSKQSGKRWLPPVIAGAVVALLAVVLTRPWEKARSSPAVSTPAPLPSAAPPALSSSNGVSEARQLARRAFAPVAVGTPSREQLDSAEALCDRAIALDSTDPELWIIAAQIDLRLILNGYDASAVRRERAMKNASRAVALAPDLYEARAVKATVLASVATSDAMRADAEAQLLVLLKEKPADQSVLSLLAILSRKAGRFAASADYFERIDSPGGAAWSYYYGDDFARAEEATERSLKKGRSHSMIALKAILTEVYREDLPAAQAIIREVPAAAFLEENPAFNAVNFAFKDRRPDKVIEILGALPTDYFSIFIFHGPKALLTGRAHEMAGRLEAARADWQVALRVVEKKLGEMSNDPDLLRQKAEVLACLGDNAAAETALRLAAQLRGTPADQVTLDDLAVRLRLGQKEQVLAFLSTALQTRGPGWRRLHADARFNPNYDPLRGDPRFEKLLRDNLPEGAKPMEEPAAK